MSDNITPMREDAQYYVRIPLDEARELRDLCKRAMSPGAAQFVAGQLFMYLHLSIANDKMGGKTDR